MIQHRKKGKEGQTASDQASSDDDDGAMGYLPTSLTGACGGGGGGDDEPWFSFLDSRTKGGGAYRSLLLAVVVVDVLAFFASTLDSLQVCCYGYVRRLEVLRRLSQQYQMYYQYSSILAVYRQYVANTSTSKGHSLDFLQVCSLFVIFFCGLGGKPADWQSTTAVSTSVACPHV